ncbi:MAG: hypothetical protein M3142_13430, partial [Bacteroidota bacterium]|nr:hypothetical protein [Bacteroidota bacterium]
MKAGSTLNSFLLLVVSAVSYLFLGYYTERSNFTLLLLLFGFAFAAYYKLSQRKLPVKTIFWAAILFRFLLLFSWPALSDDYYRFIWDGRLLAAGKNPFLHLPTFYLSNPDKITGINSKLLEQLNSPEYYTVYPPICQFIFAFCACLFPDNNWGMVIGMRLFI